MEIIAGFQSVGKSNPLVKVAVIKDVLTACKSHTVSLGRFQIGDGTVKIAEYSRIYILLLVNFRLGVLGGFRARDVAEQVSQYAVIEGKQSLHHAAHIDIFRIQTAFFCLCKGKFKVVDVVVCAVPLIVAGA